MPSDLTAIPEPSAPTTGTPEDAIEDAVEDETWELTKILSVAQVTGQHPVLCQTEGCCLKAAVVYVSSQTPDEKWWSCLDCQVSEFK